MSNDRVIERIAVSLIMRGDDQRKLIETLQSRGYYIYTTGDVIDRINNREGLELYKRGQSFNAFWLLLANRTKLDLIQTFLRGPAKPIVGALCFLPFPDKLQRQSNPASTS